MAQRKSKKTNKSKSKKLAFLLIKIGIGLVVLSVVLFLLIFFPVITQEIKYRVISLSRVAQKKEITPIDKNFGIVIPKIGANARVIPNVNPYDVKEYQYQLTKGVAHARGTVYPGQVGNIFIFSHSSVNFYEARRYNSVFYLLNKMKKGDEIYLAYKGEKFTYKVTDKKIVDASDIQYLNSNYQGKKLTLMTCWPAGTTLKRLLIFAEITPKP